MWRNRNVWIVLSGELIAGLGLWLGIIGNLEFMQQNIPSDFKKSVILFIGLLAGVVVGPLAGNVIDRYSKKAILVYASLGRMVSVLFMFWAIAEQEIFFMVLFLIVIQISAAFYFPALQAVIPMIVEEKEILDLNRVHMNVGTISRIAGTALAGFLLTIVSLSTLYVGSMVAYFALFVATFYLQVPEEEQNKSKKKEKTSFVEVFPILKQNDIALRAVILMIVPIIFIGGFNLMVIELSEWHQEASMKGMIYTVEGIGFLLGAFLVKRLTEVVDHEKLMLLFAIFISIAHLLLFYSEYKSTIYISFAVFGISAGCFFPIVTTILQTKVDRAYHGRLFSFRSMYDRILFQIVLLLTGLFLDTIGLQKMVLLFGLFSLFTVSFVYYQKRFLTNAVAKKV
ncbi:MFS transporter [Bacillus kexueae]|uniref:MFS transporter n=1 Tax=Aeribacillus kexueae TaxID=2078952 RepID=UPI00311AB3EF